MAKEKIKKEDKVKKPSFFFYLVAAYVTRPFFKMMWNHKVVRDKRVKELDGPIVAVGNHSSTIDVVMSILALLPRRYNVITGKDLFTWKEIAPFMKAFGCIPKNQCSLDLASMRTMKNAVEQGRNLLLYPEGRTSLDGTNLKYLPKTIGKFLKFLDCNVVLVHTDGAYATRPRFATGFRKGKTVTHTEVLFTREELKAAKNNEVYEKVREGIAFNDNIYQIENGLRFKTKTPAQNLDYILYKCPKCGAEYENVSDGRVITCNACGNTVEYTEYGHLVPTEGSVAYDRIDLWYDYERQSVTAEIRSPDFCLEKEVEIHIVDAELNKFVKKGEGKLYLNSEEIGYVGTVDGEETTLVQPLQGINSIVTKNKEGVDLTFNDTIHRFLFKEKKWSSKYGLAVEQIFGLKNGFCE